MTLMRTEMGVYVLKNDTHLSQHIIQHARLDIPVNIEEILPYAHLIPVGGCVVDAGACLGDHAAIYSQIVGATGRVYAFEPHPLAYMALKMNMARLSNVEIFNYALSDMSGMVRLQPCENVGASFVSDAGEYDVCCTKLDDVIGMCSFIHLDAEGYEYRILKGAQQLIEEYRPVMSIEVCDQHLRRAGSSEDALMSLLDELGYQVNSPSPYRDLRNDLCVPR